MQTILVTGAASGIGRKLTEALLARGDRVCAVDLHEAALASLESEHGFLLTQALDVRDSGGWETVLNHVEQVWGCPDVVMNVAGVLRHGYCWEITSQDLDLQLDINAKGVILGTAAAARRMKDRGRGQIINIASLAGVAPTPGLPVYSASKFAVRGFSLAAATELAEFGVNVTVVCPDAVRTPMLDQQQGHEQTAMTFSGSRALTVDDVCDAVLEQALVYAPLEILLPRSRGALAKFSSLFPRILPAAYAMMRKRGLKQQASYRRVDGQSN